MGYNRANTSPLLNCSLQRADEMGGARGGRIQDYSLAESLM
jgi:hypothetical protein